MKLFTLRLDKRVSIETTGTAANTPVSSPYVHYAAAKFATSRAPAKNRTVRHLELVPAFLSSLYLTLSSTPLGQLVPVPKVSVLERVDCIIIIISQYKTLEC